MPFLARHGAQSRHGHPRSDAAIASGRVQQRGPRGAAAPRQGAGRNQVVRGPGAQELRGEGPSTLPRALRRHPRADHSARQNQPRSQRSVEGGT